MKLRVKELLKEKGKTKRRKEKWKEKMFGKHTLKNS